MSNSIEGIVQKIHKGKEYSTKTGNKGYSAFFEINGATYKQPYVTSGTDLAKEGDTVKFEYEETFDNYSNMPMKQISKGTFQNISNPSATAKKGGGNGYRAPDPEQQLQIVNQSQVTNAVNILKHNLEGGKIQKEMVTDLAAYLVDWVYTNKPKSFLKQPENSPKNDNPTIDGYMKSQDARFDENDQPNF